MIVKVLAGQRMVGIQDDSFCCYSCHKTFCAVENFDLIPLLNGVWFIEVAPWNGEDESGLMRAECPFTGNAEFSLFIYAHAREVLFQPGQDHARTVSVNLRWSLSIVCQQGSMLVFQQDAQRNDPTGFDHFSIF
jgi:hypothetical protein